LIFPGGFATGIAHSAVFIGLTSSVAVGEVAIAGSGLYLSGNVGGLVGSAGSSLVFQLALQKNIWKAVESLPNGKEVIASPYSAWKVPGFSHDFRFSERLCPMSTIFRWRAQPSGDF
jgi:hypothetical protein